MKTPSRLLILLAGALVLALALPGCSDDDDDNPTGPGDGSDTTAPRVVSVSPAAGSIRVATDAMVVVTFNEAMDLDSDDGAVTLSHGTITGQSWTGNRTLSISHDGWPEATQIEITVGTDLADEAGNNLASALTVSFWTESSVLAFLDSAPADGAVDVNRNASVMLLFSTGMNQASLLGGVTIADDTKTVYDFSVSEGEAGVYTLDPVDTFPANTLITVTIGTGVQSVDGEFLAAEQSFDFTTGTEADSTPPTIIGFDPASGSTMDPDHGSLTVTFSEPMNTSTFAPTRMNGQFAWLASLSGGVELLWNGDNTEVTVPVPDDLPAGLHLELTFAGYADANGVVQDGETEWSVTVAGDGSPYPVSDGARYTMLGSWESGVQGSSDPTDSGDEEIYYQFVARAAANQWNLEEYFDPGYATLDYYDIFEVTSSGVRWLGFAEEQSKSGGVDKEFTEILFSNPVLMAALPLQVSDDWSTDTQVTFPGEGTLDATLSGEVVARDDLPFVDSGEIEIYWSDAWQINMLLEGSADGQPILSEERTYWFVVGIGMVRQDAYEENYDEGWWERSQTWLDIGEGR